MEFRFLSLGELSSYIEGICMQLPRMAPGMSRTTCSSALSSWSKDAVIFFNLPYS